MKNKPILAIVLIAAFSAQKGYAEDSSQLTNVQKLVEDRFLDSWTAYARQVNACSEKGSALDPKLFEGMDASPAQILTAITYFHNKAQNDCFEQEARDFLVAKHLMQEAGLAERIDEVSGDSSLASTSLTFWWHEVRAEAEFRQMPEDLQRQFEAIEQLQEPFAMRQTIVTLGLMPE